MGVYDFLVGKCPGCERVLRDPPNVGLQVKWFVGIPNPGVSHRAFFPGDELPVTLPDGEYEPYAVEDDSCVCEHPSLVIPPLAVIKDGKFMGFVKRSYGVVHVVDREGVVTQVIRNYLRPLLDE